MNQQQFTPRYLVRSEPAPAPKPRWWRSMWWVIDTQTDEVVGKWLASGTAQVDAQCRNRPELAFCSHTANLAESNAERWGWSS